MSYTLISGEVIPAVTGGVFSYYRTLTVSDLLLTSPAYILACYIIAEGIGSMTDPDDSASVDWPLYVSYQPDGQGVETNLGTMYDSSGVKHGRLMVGPVIGHYGVQLRIRSDTHIVGYAKAEEIAVALDAVLNDLVTIGATAYLIYNVTRGLVIPLGVERGTRKRRLFTVNFLVTLKRVT